MKCLFVCALVLGIATANLDEDLLREFEAADGDHDGLIKASEFIHFFKEAHPDEGFIEFHNPAKGGENAVPEQFRQNVLNAEFATANFWKAFVNSVAMILATEIGDKTFFIAAILAMRYPRMLVFGGAIGALAVMTVLSVIMGFVLPNLLPKAYTHYAGAVLFAYFGIKTLKEAFEMKTSGVSEELQEVEEELGHATEDKDLDIESAEKVKEVEDKEAWKVFTQSFTLTFLAEWGDRSQIATIALAAAKDPYGVTFGGILGHSFCSGVAVIGGRLLAAKISERSVAYFGGFMFMLFAIHSFVMGPEQ